MFKQGFIVVISLFVISCGSHKPVGRVLPKEIMVPVLVDIQLTEAQINTGGPFVGGRSLKVIAAYDSIFNKYKIQPEDFYESFRYYRSHPAEMDSLYEKVIIELTKRESEAAKRTPDPGNHADSSAAKRIKPGTGEP